MLIRNKILSTVSILRRQNVYQSILSQAPNLLVVRNLHNSSQAFTRFVASGQKSRPPKYFYIGRKKLEDKKVVDLTKDLKELPINSHIELSLGASPIFDFEAYEENQNKLDSDDPSDKESEENMPETRLGIPTEAKKKKYEHRYSTMNFRISPRKLRFLANQIAGKYINEAIEQMEFSHKRASRKIMNSLITARDHAWRYKMMPPEEVYIEQAFVGKGFYRKKPDYKPRGRFAWMLVKKAHMKYILKLRQPEEDKGIGTQRKLGGKMFKYKKNPWVPLIETKPIYNPPRVYNW
ncbi:hypothetical protein Glove_124g10 [Diversispora epigaea]|uniref:Ribosomal protein L22 n=1 Tax=Diversispora epigaea TaxID=1348612 RepID=A0A397IYF7_9GLOM|nr:hypothetical protein Glove_124g10 [Diversispora epigaea]